MSKPKSDNSTETVSWLRRHELPRKSLHGSIAVVSTILYCNGVQLSQVTPVLVAALIPIATLELARFSSAKLNSAYIKCVGPLMRESEKKNQQVNGVIWYLVGLITVFVLFPKDVSFVSIYLLSWADLAASTIGRAYGHRSIKIVGNKSLAGTLAAFVASFVSIVLIYRVLLPQWAEYNPPSVIMYNEHLSKLPLWALAAYMGLAAALSELFPVIDDNLSIPIICASAQWLVVKLTTLPYSYGVLM